jgi:hypothetical protein
MAMTTLLISSLIGAVDAIERISVPEAFHHGSGPFEADITTNGLL